MTRVPLTVSWNKDLFPDHVDFMAKFHDKDLKITLNTHPGDGVRSFEDCYERLCKALDRDPARGDVRFPTLYPADASPSILIRPIASFSRRTSPKCTTRSRTKAATFGGPTGSRANSRASPASTRCGCSITIISSTRSENSAGA